VIQEVLMWASAVLNALGFMAAALAIIIYVMAWRSVRRTPGVVYVLTQAALQRWLLFNAAMMLVLAATALRWLVIHDIALIRGGHPTTGSLDDVAWAGLDLVLTVTPLLLLAGLRPARRVAAPPDNEGA
jgi:hypothetical protein